MRRKLLAATGNAHKIDEFRGILGPLGIEFVAPDEVGGIPEPEESGTTFEENAAIKALSAARHSGMDSFADDSGLEIDALGGAPGIFSSRYADDDAARIARVLREMRGEENRVARFVCAVAVASPDGRVEVVRGTVEGRLLREPRGDGGFGYDPIFVPDGYDATFAELPSEKKDSISHRANALRAASRMLSDWGATGG